MAFNTLARHDLESVPNEKIKLIIPIKEQAGAKGVIVAILAASCSKCYLNSMA